LNPKLLDRVYQYQNYQLTEKKVMHSRRIMQYFLIKICPEDRIESIEMLAIRSTICDNFELFEVNLPDNGNHFNIVS